MARDDGPGGSSEHQVPTGYAGLPSRQHIYVWWLRLVICGTSIGGVALHELGLLAPIGIFAAGVVFGIVLDRFVLWPVAVFLARVDGRFRSR